MPIIDLTSTEDLSGATVLWRITVEEYTYELFSNNRAVVYKGDSSTPSYIVDKDGCNCPAAQYGKTDCKHRSRLTWLGDGVRADSVNNEREAYAISKNTTSQEDPFNINDLL